MGSGVSLLGAKVRKKSIYASFFMRKIKIN